MNAKQQRQFKAVIGKYGLTLEHGSKHYAVVKDGVRVGTLAGTGECNALRQAIRDLARQGLVGAEERRVKF